MKLRILKQHAGTTRGAESDHRVGEGSFFSDLAELAGAQNLPSSSTRPQDRSVSYLYYTSITIKFQALLLRK